MFYLFRQRIVMMLHCEAALSVKRNFEYDNFIKPYVRLIFYLQFGGIFRNCKRNCSVYISAGRECAGEIHSAFAKSFKKIELVTCGIISISAEICIHYCTRIFSNILCTE